MLWGIIYLQGIVKTMGDNEFQGQECREKQKCIRECSCSGKGKRKKSQQKRDKREKMGGWGAALVRG